MSDLCKMEKECAFVMITAEQLTKLHHLYWQKLPIFLSKAILRKIPPQLTEYYTYERIKCA
jgi:hypothetical protein